jgi:hypothetical protein
VVVVSALLVVIVVAVAVAVRAGRSDGGPKGAALLGSGRPAAYRILYRVQQSAAPPTTVVWEILSARRPFDIRKVTFSQRPTPGDRPTGGTLTDVDHLYVVRPDGIHAVSGRQPALGTADQALAPVMQAAVDRGLAKAGDARTVAGRRCRDYRFLEPPAGPIKSLRGSDNDQICLDADGLVLREAYTLKGKLVMLREAQEVTIDPPGLDAELDVSAVSPSTDANAPSAEQLDDPSAAAGVPAPAGFSPPAVVSFALPSPPGTGGPPLLYQSTVWAFTRGADLITVEAGGGGAVPWVDTDPSQAVSLPVGPAESVIRSDGAELRVDLGGGRWLRVRGTVSPEALADYARTLPRAA